MYQIQKTTTRPQITAHLAQTMTLLTKAVDELNEEIEKEVSSNPALEMAEELHCPMCNRVIPRNGQCPHCSQPKSSSADETIVFISPRNDFVSGTSQPNEDFQDEQISIMAEDLPTNVLKQIATELAKEDRSIAAYLLNQLNDDGLLEIDFNELAEYFHVPIERILNVQKIIQHADPIGVGSSTAQQALLIQLDTLADTTEIPFKTREIIENYFKELMQRHYKEISKQMSISLESVKKTAIFVGNNLNPYPARAHWGNERQPESFENNVYRHPDILISHLNNDPNNPLMVEVILPVRGTLQINPVIKEAIKQSEGDARDDLKGDLEKASLFIKCIQQRNNTMQRLMERIVAHQRGFILGGEMQLKPITRVKISRELKVHESTISRAVANKSVKLPNGQIIPLSLFFERNLNIRAIIREMINNEKKSLSDSRIVELLKAKKIHIARRTVAKYRAMDGVLPAHLRKAIQKKKE